MISSKMENLCLSCFLIYLKGELVKEDSQNYTIDHNKSTEK